MGTLTSLLQGREIYELINNPFNLVRKCQEDLNLVISCAKSTLLLWSWDPLDVGHF